MSFIAKNPLTAPEVESSPFTPRPGTRGLFAGKDGWYDVDSNNKVTKITGGGTSGDVSGEIENLKEMINSLKAKSLVRTVSISIPASGWITRSDSLYSQSISIDGITEYSKIDLQPTMEQLTIFYEKDITFVTENDGGDVTVYCIGQKPANNYEIQATITEVEREND